ncbi:MAG TPA: ribosome assembly RNA-binding protein YhbY [Thermoanaerobaculia bacterium]|nr:ribosome assembly RNA-binding protein YhbY [Thermoanaerobaculia bacterium]
MTVLTSKQKQYLKGLAHPLAPVVRVGRGRVSEAVVAETKKSLASHELIKVRIDADDSAARKELAQQLASATDSQIAGMVGKTLILYREREEDPEIELP